ncbi:hypothetical protein [Pseudoduganella sp.]|uniref:hypothetical protein n=1 Tax=Pseudoduganella sp. TaxID=1880898 RepID=UPI0035B3ABAF
MADPDFSPLSLSQHFTAPDGFTGAFGWVCGYSADAEFMDIAAERFTGLTSAARAAAGRLYLALMLDSGSRQISPVAAPGVLHIAALKRVGPYRLMHAKVALLGYRHKEEAGRWLLRLVVSTGNWTCQTLRDSLDLAWRVDLDSAALPGPDDDERLDCADIAAAWDMLRWLRKRYDADIFGIQDEAGAQSPGQLAARELERWIAAASRRGKDVQPRFIDNRGMSLLDAMVGTFPDRGERVSRNYIALGSGFFEGKGSNAEEPAVLRQIVTTLQDEGMLTKNPYADVFVDPSACQAVSATAKTMIDNGWTIRAAGQPSEPERKLHAKFIFSANLRSTSNNCSSPWLYMGSGNLTAPGFTSRASANGGNLEAGIVLVPDELYWEGGKHVDPACVLGNVLPVQRDRKLEDVAALREGAGMEEREAEFAELPLSYLYWRADDGGGWLCPELPEKLTGTQLSTSTGECIEPQPGKGYWWPAAMPRQVMLLWGAGAHQALVPVIDQFGRVAGGKLADLDLDAASWELSRFPGTGDEEDPPEDDPADPDQGQEPGGGRRSGGVGQYAMRRMMALVEQIAETQCGLRQADWQAWCYRLEQVLVQARRSAALEEFSRLGLNPFSPLYLPAFRPVFAEKSDSEAGLLYEGVLRRVEQAWGVAGFEPMGASA